MAEPTKKHPEIERFINEMNPSGRKRYPSIKQNICVSCGESATQFRDDLSAKEYTISGWCQKCQDDFFGLEEE